MSFDLLQHPAIQSSIVPLLASVLIAIALLPLRLSGVGAAGGWLVAVYVIGNFALEPLTATRKIVVVGVGAALLGAVADFAFKPTRAACIALGALFGAASVWVFWSVLAQQPTSQAIIAGGGAAALAFWLTAAMLPLHDDPARAGAAGLGLGLGTGTAAILGASALLGQYGLALGASCGGVLLLVMLIGKRATAGTSLVLPAAVTAALITAGAVLLAELTWWAAAALATVPLAVRVPLSAKFPLWLKAFLASVLAVLVAAIACVIAYPATRT